jgi:hypothetical protein
MTDLAKDKIEEARLCPTEAKSSTPSNAGSMAIGSTPISISITPQIGSLETDCCNRRRQS